MISSGLQPDRLLRGGIQVRGVVTVHQSGMLGPGTVPGTDKPQSDMKQPDSPYITGIVSYLFNSYALSL